MTRSWSRWLPLAMPFVAAAASADDAVPVAPAAPSCPATLTSPKPVAIAPVVLPAFVWETKPTLKARVHFRIDDDGHPIDVKANVLTKTDDDSALSQAIGDAFARNRYCRPADLSTGSKWAANVLLSPGPKLDGVDGVYVQSFVPSFVGLEVFGHHPGAVVVRGTYGPDGRARRVELVTGSGDKVIDDKGLDMMASAQLIFRNGVAPRSPVVLSRPITFIH